MLRSAVSSVVRKIQDVTGYDRTNWLRVCQIRSIETFMRTRPAGSILEVSPGWNSHWAQCQSTSYKAVNFPDFDITSDVMTETFDYVIADQVLEHVSHPLRALVNIRQMLNKDGVAIVSAPFLFRVHGRPNDFCRWTSDGLRVLLQDAGFEPAKVAVHSWGNTACAKAHIGGPVRDFGYGRDLTNHPEYPMIVWAFAEAG